MLISRTLDVKIDLYTFQINEEIIYLHLFNNAQNTILLTVTSVSRIILMR